MLRERRQFRVRGDAGDGFGNGLADGLARLFAGVGKRGAAAAAAVGRRVRELIGDALVFGVERRGPFEVLDGAGAIPLGGNLFETGHELLPGRRIQDEVPQLELGGHRRGAVGPRDELLRVDGTATGGEILDQQRDVAKPATVLDNRGASPVIDLPVVAAKPEHVAGRKRGGGRWWRSGGGDGLTRHRLWRHEAARHPGFQFSLSERTRTEHRAGSRGAWDRLHGESPSKVETSRRRTPYIPRERNMGPARRLLPRKISVAVLDNMRASLMPLPYSTIAPTFYLVYLHPDDFAAIQAVVPLLREQINRALNDEIAQVGKEPWWGQVLHPGREALPPIDVAAPRTIEIVPDPNEEVPPGEVGVHSELRLPAVGEYAGAPTVRVTATTTVVAAQVDRCDHTVPIAAASVAERIPAWLTIDDLEGRREHGVIDNPTLVGRGGLGCYVHVRLRTEGQVSKEHCRIRRDEQSGDFFIKDLSRNGTSVNGVRLPPGVEYSGSAKREIPGAEVPLLDGARISLADVLSLEFRRA